MNRDCCTRSAGKLRCQGRDGQRGVDGGDGVAAVAHFVEGGGGAGGHEVLGLQPPLHRPSAPGRGSFIPFIRTHLWTF